MVRRSASCSWVKIIFIVLLNALETGDAKTVGLQRPSLGLLADIQQIPEQGAGIPRIDQPVVPQTGAAVERGGLAVEFLRGDLLQHVEHFRVRHQAILELLGLGDDPQHLAGLSATHDCSAAVGPGEDETRIEATAAHRVVAGTVGATDDDGQFRYSGIGHRLNHLCAVLDHPLLFRFGADHKPRGVVEKQQRRLALVAELNELRRFARTLGRDRTVVTDKAAGAALNVQVAANSLLIELSLEFDQQTVCGHLHIQGRACGFIGNNGPITPKGASKAAQFIQLCDQSQTPLLFFHNTTGFMVGTESEQQGVIKHGAKMIQAVANARVPKLTIVVGGSYGTGNYAMCGRGLDPRFIFAWPNSRTAVMGGAQAGKVLRIVTEAKQLKDGMVPDPKMLDMLEQAAAQKLDSQSTALYGSASLWDDGLIDPRDTRTLLGYLLDICHEAEVRPLQANSFGVARF